MTRFCSLLLTLTFTLLVLLRPARLKAEEYRWIGDLANGNYSGDFSNPASWRNPVGDPGVPTGNDIATFDLNTAFAVKLNGESVAETRLYGGLISLDGEHHTETATIRTITTVLPDGALHTANMWVGDTLTGSLYISPGASATLTQRSQLNVGVIGGEGTGLVALLGDDAEFNVSSGGLTLGMAAGGSGQLFVEAGAHLHVTEVTGQHSAIVLAAAPSSNGLLVIRGSGATFNAGPGPLPIEIGRGGSGRFDLLNSAQANGGVLIGTEASGNGYVVVAGGGTQLQGGDLEIARAGIGRLDVLSSATVEADRVTLGTVSGSNATVQIMDSQFNAGSEGIEIARAGSARVDVTAGGTLRIAGGGIFIGVDSGSNGTLYAEGDQSAVDLSSGDVEVGRDGSGWFGFADGATGSASAATRLGTNPNGSGVLVVTGSGSSYEAPGATTIGVRGTGWFEAGQGGKVTSGATTLAEDSGSFGTALVRNSGSEWTVDGSMTVGDRGNGTLTILDRGEVAAQDEVKLGEQSGGSGRIDVIGMGSLFTAQQTLQIGGGGNGVLNLSDHSRIVSNAEVSLGHGAGGDGRAFLSNNATWDVYGELTVGTEGFGQISVDDNSQLRSGTAILGKSAGGIGRVDVDRVGANWEVAGDLTIGDQGSGYVTLKEHAQLTVSQRTIVGGHGTGDLTLSGTEARAYSYGGATIGQEAGSYGTVALSGEDAWWFVGGDGLIVGERGHGELIVADKRTVNVTGEIVVALEEGSEGSITLEGEDAVITSGNNLVLGGAGNARFEIKGGASHSNNAVTISEASASEASGTGELVVAGEGSAYETTGQFVIGGGGKGLLRIRESGTLNSRDGVILGRDEGSEADILLSSEVGDAAWTVDGPFTASRGVSVVRVNDQAKLRVNSDVTLGAHATGSATFHLDGNQASLDVFGDLYVGQLGVGVVNVRNGATVTANSAILSSGLGGSDAHAEVIVSGMGSKLTTRNDLTLGIGGYGASRGDLDILDRGTVHTQGSVVLSRDADSISEADVDGEGSLWEIDGNITVGKKAFAELLVLNGGRVTAFSSDTFVIGAEAGSHGIVHVNANQTGVKTTLIHGGLLQVGDAGQGSMHIANNGEVLTLGNANVGSPGQPHSGHVTISESSWNVALDLHVENGAVQVSDGGQLHASSVVVAPLASSQARISFDSGVGTVVTRLTIAPQGGVGKVELRNGASLTIGQEINTGRGGVVDVTGGSVVVGSGAGLSASGTLLLRPGGKLSGTGRVVGRVVNNGGVISPGNSPGTLVIEGDFEQTTGGVLFFETAGNVEDAHDVLHVTGRASIGGDVTLMFTGFTPAAGESIELITSDTEIVGSFADVSVCGIESGWQYSMTVQGTALKLTSLNNAIGYLIGDANRDGEVNRGDAAILAYEFGASMSTAENRADFNCDGRVDLQDLTLLQQRLSASAAPHFTAVPEPGTLYPLILAASMLALSRRRATR